MSLTEADLKRAAEAVVAQQGSGALVSVSRYIVCLRRERRTDLAEHWERIADWIVALAPRSVH